MVPVQADDRRSGDFAEGRTSEPGAQRFSDTPWQVFRTRAAGSTRRPRRCRRDAPVGWHEPAGCTGPGRLPRRAGSPQPVPWVLQSGGGTVAFEGQPQGLCPYVGHDSVLRVLVAAGAMETPRSRWSRQGLAIRLGTSLRTCCGNGGRAGPREPRTCPTSDGRIG